MSAYLLYYDFSSYNFPYPENKGAKKKRLINIENILNCNKNLINF